MSLQEGGCMRPWVVLSFLLVLGVIPAAHAFDRFTGHGGPVKGIAYSAEANLVVTASFDYTAVVWAADTMQEITQLVAHTAAVNTAAFSPDGQWLVTGGDDGAIYLWDVPTLKNSPSTIQPVALLGHQAKIVHLSFNASGSALLSSSWDHRVGVWDLQSSPHQVRFLEGHQGPVNAALFSEDGRSIYSAGGDGHIRYWNASTGEYIRSPVRNGFGVNVMAIDYEVGVLAYGGANGVMKALNLDGSGSELELWLGGPPVLGVSIDPESKIMAFGTSEGRVVIADALVGEISHDFLAVKGPIWAMAFTENAEHLMIAGLDDWLTRIPLENLIVPHPLAAQDRRFHPEEPVDNGQRQFARKCSVCHSLTPSSERRAGPTLYGVFGRKVGEVGDYPYSPELLEMNLVWNEESIDRLFRDGPDIVTPGSKMPIQRIKTKKDRDDLISYLKRATAPVSQ
jgi:cytochrome c